MSNAPSRSDLFWCQTCGVPLLTRTCESCGGTGVRVVSDMRPVFPEEKHLLEQQLGEKLPGPCELLWMRRGTIWFNGGRLLHLSSDREPSLYKRYELSRLAIQTPKRIPSAHTYLSANRSALEKSVCESLGFIQSAVEQFRTRPVVVSFSGGKDSTVVSHLVRRALPSEIINHAFGDTGVEYPDTYRYMECFQATNLDVRLSIARPKSEWYGMCEKLGPPSRLTAWCCSVFKAVTLADVFHVLNGHGGVLAFEGVRRLESRRRRNRPPIYEGGKIGAQVLARPILNWRDVDVWLYILAHGLEFNPAYRLGLPRVGCLYCPHQKNSTDRLLEEVYPEAMARWRQYIIDYASVNGKTDPEDYWYSGAWKFRVGSTDAARSTYIAARPCTDGDNITNLMLARDFQPDSVVEYLRPLGQIARTETPMGPLFTVRSLDGSVFSVHGVEGMPRAKVVILNAKNRHRSVQTITRQLRRFQCCVHCGACASVCPIGAIQVDPGAGTYEIDEASCTSCGECTSTKNLKAGCVKINTSYGKPKMTSEIANGARL